MAALSGWAQDAGPNNQAAAPPAARPNLSSADLFPKVVEDFSTPALTVSTQLDGISALQMQMDDDDPLFTREVTRVQWRPADPIDLYIMKPVGRKKPPVVVYLYDYPTENDRFLNREFCRLLVKQGFAAVGFVSALTGQRYHDRPMKEWFVSEMPEALASTAHDVQIILTYLGQRGDLDVSHAGMYGEGSGATIAILAAAVDSRIQTLDLLSPWGDWPTWIAQTTRIPERERPDFTKPDYLAKVAPLDPVKWLPKLKTQKIRLVNVRSFAEIPPAAQLKLEAAAPANAQIFQYEDSKAFVAALPADQRLNWMKQQMQAGASREYRANKSGASGSRAPDAETSQR